MNAVWIVTEPSWDNVDIVGVYPTMQSVIAAFPKGKWEPDDFVPADEEPTRWQTSDGRVRFRVAERYEVSS